MEISEFMDISRHQPTVVCGTSVALAYDVDVSTHQMLNAHKIPYFCFLSQADLTYNFRRDIQGSWCW